jgi:prepilin peptidase CpaA
LNAALLPITPLAAPLAAALTVLVLVAAVRDYRFRRIPNWLSLSGILTGLALNSILFGLSGLGGALKAAGYGFAVYFGLYLLRAMGAADVKLMSAVGAIAGPGRWFTIFILTALIGGVTGILLILYRGRFRHTFWNMGFVLWELMHLRPPHLASEELDVRSTRGLTLPAGVRIAAGSLAFLLISTIWGR